MGHDTRDRTRRLASTLLPPVAVLACAIAVWEAVVRLAGTSPSVLPAPSRIARAAWDDRDQLASDAWATLAETLAGLGIALVVAVVVALAVDRFVAVRRGLLPLLVVSQTLPVIALAPLMVVWLGFTAWPRILVVALYTFFPICIGLVHGLAAVGADGVDLLRTMGARRSQILRHVRLPAAAGSAFTGLRLAVTYAVSAAVTAEWLGGFDGLGIYMVRAHNSFQPDLIFAAVGVTAILTLALYALVALAERLFAPWLRDRHA